MYRVIAAFLVMLTLLLPGLGAASGVVAAAGEVRSVAMDDHVVAVGASQLGDMAQPDDGSAFLAADFDLADGPGDMPVLLESPKSTTVARLAPEALPAFVQGDAPSPFLEGLRRPPRHVRISA